MSNVEVGSGAISSADERTEHKLEILAKNKAPYGQKSKFAVVDDSEMSDESESNDSV